MFLLVLFLCKQQQKPISDTVKQREAQAVVKETGRMKQKNKENCKAKARENPRNKTKSTKLLKIVCYN